MQIGKTIQERKSTRRTVAGATASQIKSRLRRCRDGERSGGHLRESITGPLVLIQPPFETHRNPASLGTFSRLQTRLVLLAHPLGGRPPGRVEWWFAWSRSPDRP